MRDKIKSQIIETLSLELKTSRDIWRERKKDFEKSAEFIIGSEKQTISGLNCLQKWNKVSLNNLLAKPLIFQ